MLRAVGLCRAATDLAARGAAVEAGVAAGARVDVSDRNKEAWPCDLLEEPTDWLAARNAFPRDADIVFFEGPHIYEIRGLAAALSVTGLCGAPFPHKFDKHEAIANMKPTTRADRYPDMTDSEIFEAWETNRNEASRLGTKMHAAIEVFWNTHKVSKDPEIAPEMGQFLQFYHAEMVARNIVPYRTEPTVFADGLPTPVPGKPELGMLPGSVDFLGVDDKGVFWVLDWKRTNKLTTEGYNRFGTPPFEELADCNVSKYSLQLHLYRQIFQLHYGIAIPEENLYMVTFHVKEPTYKMVQAKPVAHLAKRLLDQFDVWGALAIA